MSNIVDASSELQRYFAVTGREVSLMPELTSISATQHSVEDLIFQLFMDLTGDGGGGRLMSDIANKIEERTKDSDMSEIFQTRLRIFSDFVKEGIPGFDVITMSEILTSVDQKLKDDGILISTIMLNDVGLMPVGRHANHVALFLSSIPTLELSRCVPYVDVRVITSHSPIDGKNKLASLSLNRFLRGEAEVNGETDILMSTSDVTSDGRSVAGMELFTSPQILVDGDGKSSRGIDVFRPFMSLMKFTINVAPTTGVMFYKTGKMEIILHDRGRLWEIKDFVRPDMYGQTELLIEYGWNHPEGSAASHNVFGYFMNSLKSREKYGIKNSSFVFDNVGQVNITLELYMKGGIDLDVVTIGTTRESENVLLTINKLVEEIASFIKEKQGQQNSSVDVRGMQILESISDVSSALSLDKESIKKLNDAILKAKKEGNQSALDLEKVLVDLYGKDGTQGKKRDLEDIGSKSLLEKKSEIVSRSPNTADPFLVEDSTIKSSEFVSLGKIILLYIVTPIASTGKFKEVQTLFYPFNANAAAMHDKNIASFPIRKMKFESEYTKLANDRKNLNNVSTGEFLSWLSSTFLEDRGSEGYGMQGIYKSTKPIYPPKPKTSASSTSSSPKKSRPKNDTRQKNQTEKEFEENATTLNTATEIRMKELGILDGEYKEPMVEMYIETVPLATNLDQLAIINILRDDSTTISEEKKGIEGESILRIHFMDRQASPYAKQSRMLEVMSKGLGVIIDDTGNAEEDAMLHKKRSQEAITAALNARLIESVLNNSVDASGIYKFANNVGPETIKRNISSLVPTILYGISVGGLKSAIFRSIIIPELNTIHMQKTFNGDPTAAPGVDGSIVPLQVLPTSLDLEIFGCPLVNFAQQYFVDFGTSTSVDNIYGVVGIDHEITPGKFDTRIKMINIDCYGSYRSAVAGVKAAIAALGSEEV